MHASCPIHISLDCIALCRGLSSPPPRGASSLAQPPRAAGAAGLPAAACTLCGSATTKWRPSTAPRSRQRWLALPQQAAGSGWSGATKLPPTPPILACCAWLLRARPSSRWVLGFLNTAYRAHVLLTCWAQACIHTLPGHRWTPMLSSMQPLVLQEPGCCRPYSLWSGLRCCHALGPAGTPGAAALRSGRAS